MAERIKPREGGDCVERVTLTSPHIVDRQRADAFLLTPPWPLEQYCLNSFARSQIHGLQTLCLHLNSKPS